jgi:Cys-rich repeat protein
MRTSNWISGLVVLASAALLLRATACLDPGVCLRNSDCSNGFVCITGACVPPPLDGGDSATPSDDGATESSVEASTEDASDAADSSPIDASNDGGEAGDASTDASDASDAPDSG